MPVAVSRCPDCGHDFLVAFSYKGRGVCPSCNARRMAA
nr:transposase zinc-binding domain-containing protein [Thiorhodovibrio frisius]